MSDDGPSDADRLIRLLQERVADDARRVEMGTLVRYPVAERTALEAAQAQLGFALPSFFKRLLTEVANGGFGPGYGLLGLPPAGHVDDDIGRNLVEDYLDLRADSDPVLWWPPKVVPLCNWGCAIWSCMDCEGSSGRILTCESVEAGFQFHVAAGSLLAWLSGWVEGRRLWNEMYEAVGGRSGINPFTREPMEIPLQRPKGERETFSDRR